MKKIRIAVLGLAALMTIGSMCACDGDGDPVPDGETVKGTETSHTPDEGTENSGSSETEKPGTGTTSSEESTAPPQSPVKTWNDYSIYSIGAYRDGLAPLETTDGYGYVNTKGEVVIPPIFSEAEPFHNSVARIKQDNGYGYIDTTGKTLLEPVYDELPLSFEDIICAKKGDKRQYLTIDGTVIYTETGDEVKLGEVSNGYFWVETVEELLSGNVHTVTYYSKDGKAFSFENASHWKRYEESTNINEWGYGFIKNDATDEITMIHRDGRKVPIDLPHYEGIYAVNSAGYIRINDTRGGTIYYAFVDHETGEIEETDNSFGHLGNDYYYDCEFYNHDYYIIYHKKTELFDVKKISEFSGAHVETVRRVVVNGKDYFWVFLQSESYISFVSLIDAEGKVVISPIKKITPLQFEMGDWNDKTYTVPYAFSAGLSQIEDTETGLFGYIDLTGNQVIPAQYEKATDFWGEGDSAVAVVNGNTIINRKGEVIFSANGQN